MSEKKVIPKRAVKRRYFVYGPDGAFDEYVERDPLLEAYMKEEAPVEDKPDAYEEEEFKYRK